jgi:hypothetical protein
VQRLLQKVAVGIRRRRAGDGGTSIPPSPSSVLTRPSLLCREYDAALLPLLLSSSPQEARHTLHNNAIRLGGALHIRAASTSTAAIPTPLTAASTVPNLAVPVAAAAATPLHCVVEHICSAAALSSQSSRTDAKATSPVTETVSATECAPTAAAPPPPPSTGAIVSAICASEMLLVNHRSGFLSSLTSHQTFAHLYLMVHVVAARTVLQTWSLLYLLSIAVALGGCCIAILSADERRSMDSSILHSIVTSPPLLQSCPSLARAWFSPVCRLPARLPVGASLLSLLLLSSASLSIGPVAVKASCSVTAPIHGTLGNCSTSLPAGASCSFGCSVGYALATAPQQTFCNRTNYLTQQTCVICSPGSTLTWDTTSLTKLVGTAAVGSWVYQGVSVSLSSDGNTLAVGGYQDNSAVGATWIFTRNSSSSSSMWSQQGSKLVGTGAVGIATQGYSVSLSSDGNTLAVGGHFDNSYAGATWIFTRNSNSSSSMWSQQGSKLVGTGAVGSAHQGSSVSLSSDGNTLAVGGPFDSYDAGATWIFTRNSNSSSSTWSQQGSKLVGTGAVGGAYQGTSVSLSSDGNTLAMGGYADNSNAGATWIFTRNSNSSSSMWSQQGSKLVGTGAVGIATQGISVSLSSDGNTLAVGGYGDNSNAGATWVGSIEGSCSTCPPGYYCSSGGGAAPTACWLTNFCPAGSSANTTCASGAYCPNPSAQLSCPDGTWNSLTGRTSATSCTVCIAGRYGSLAAQTSSASCSACPAGSFCTGGANITTCTVGQYCPANSSIAASCAAGQYCTNATITAACPAGSWSNTTGLTAASQCTPCVAGVYGSNSGQTSATNGCPFTCTAGTYGNTTGQSSQAGGCLQCTPGSFCVGGAAITACNLGQYCPAGCASSSLSSRQLLYQLEHNHAMPFWKLERQQWAHFREFVHTVCCWHIWKCLWADRC